MFYLVYGTDEQKARQQFGKLVASLKAKRPDAPVFTMSGDEFDPSFLEEKLFSVSLFDPKYLIVLKYFTESVDGKDFLETHIKEIMATEHVVLVLEKNLTKALVTKLSKYAEKVQEYSKTESKAQDFNIFALADALGERDRKKLWVLYHQALHSGIAAEEIFWRFVGQVKNMLLVARSSNPTTTKLHPFVLQKTTRALKNFSVLELTTLSGNFLDLYDDARNSRKEFETSLEKVILGL